MGFFSKLFDPSAGEIKRLNKIVDKIDSFEEAHKALSDEQLRGKTVEFRERVKNGESLDDLLPEAYSIVREATYRVTGKRQFRVQMLSQLSYAPELATPHRLNVSSAATRYIIHEPARFVNCFLKILQNKIKQGEITRIFPFTA